MYSLKWDLIKSLQTLHQWNFAKMHIAKKENKQILLVLVNNKKEGVTSRNGKSPLKKASERVVKG